jgi:NADPH-dependent 2,4-dienoyl-CoA reductase/sulfur reductase-like enzyme
MQESTADAAPTAKKPRVAVVGAGWGGWAAAKALCENGCDVTLLDGLPDPSGER